MRVARIPEQLGRLLGRYLELYYYPAGKGNLYTLTVENPVSETIIASAHHEGNRLALDNIRQRLAAFYGATAKQEVSPDRASYRVTITVPVIFHALDVEQER